jgi:hypothetical protein
MNSGVEHAMSQENSFLELAASAVLHFPHCTCTGRFADGDCRIWSMNRRCSHWLSIKGSRPGWLRWPET